MIIINNIWIFIDLLIGFKILFLRWICYIKWDTNNIFEKYKVRIITKNYTQEVRLDFDKTFILMIWIESVCILFAIVIINNLYILYIDCKNTFLNNNNNLEIYITQLEEFIDLKYSYKILYFNKSLYGLK